VSQSTLDVATPERVAVELPIAGVGSRAMAYLLDVLLIAFVAVAAYFAFTLLVPDPLNALLQLSRFARIAGAIAAFAALWIYWTLFEVLWHGQTVGKRVMRIRVVRVDGAPVTAVDSAIRNLLRLVDFFPACYPVGLLTMLFDAKHRRVGDLVAGTVLVREEAIDLTRFEARAPTAQGLSHLELDVVTDFLRRYDTLVPSARQALGRQLLARLGQPLAEGEALDDDALRTRLQAQVGGR
jgi:uncharacterized RDD family membrane protein YckC